MPSSPHTLLAHMSKSSACLTVRRENTKEGTEPGIVTVLAGRGRKPEYKKTAKTWPSLLFLLHSKLLFLVNKFSAMPWKYSRVKDLSDVSECVLNLLENILGCRVQRNQRVQRSSAGCSKAMFEGCSVVQWVARWAAVKAAPSSNLGSTPHGVSTSELTTAMRKYKCELQRMERSKVKV